MAASSDIPKAMDVFTRLNLETPPEPWLQYWEQSQRSLPDPIPFLTERYVAETCDRMRIPADQRGALVRALRFFEDEPLWKRIVWYQHQMLFGDGKLPPDPLRYMPIPEYPGEAASLYLALVFLSGVPNVFAYHASRGIPEDVTVDTLSGLGLRIEAFRSRHGHHGLRTYRGAAIRAFAGRLYRIGRLQYEMQHYPCGFRVFRNRGTGAVVSLAEPGIRFRSDGRYANAVGGSASQEVRTTELIEDDRTIRGTRISPCGKAARDIVTLDRSGWECVLRRGDPVLDMHIPAGGPMDFDACGESLRRAIAFFPRHFPEHRFVALTCHAWFLDTQFERYLKPTSNIVRFMREFYLHPAPMASGRGVMNRAFGGQIADLDRAPQDTSLRRAVIAHLKQGGHWYNGSLVMFPEDLNWGAQVYRRGERACQACGVPPDCDDAGRRG